MWWSNSTTIEWPIQLVPTQFDIGGYLYIPEAPTRNTCVLKKISRRGWREPFDKYLKNKLTKRHKTLYNNHRRMVVKREPHSKRRK